MRYTVGGIVSLSLLLAGSAVRADALESDLQRLQFTEAVMAKVGVGDLDGAFKVMKPHAIVPEAEYEALVASTKAQRAKVGGRYGKVVGWECLEEKKVGRSLTRVSCIEKTEKHALPWMFYFYKSPRGWVLNSFLWNDNVASLFPL